MCRVRVKVLVLLVASWIAGRLSVNIAGVEMLVWEVSMVWITL